MKQFQLPITLALPAMFLVGGAGAQTVEGRLFDRDASRPYAHTYVLLVDSAGQEVARTVTASDGQFHLVAPAPGPYRVLGERIGFSAVPSAPVPVVDTAVEIEVDPAFTPVVLPPPSETQECQSGPSDATRVYWEEARKALRATVATARRQELRYRIRVFERELGPDGIIRHDEDSILHDAAYVPFAAASAAGAYRTVDDDGVVSYFAPDPETLLHPRFEEGQCFQLVSGPDGRTGLAFGFDATDQIRGTFWFREETAELAGLDFEHVAFEDATGGSAHGRVSFASPSPVDWIITDWFLDLPIVVRASDSVPATVAGITTVGARTLEAKKAEEEPLYADRRIAVLEGTVYDSISGAPLVGAVAALAGTGYWAATDANGEFFLAGHLEGRYRVVFGHPHLDSLGFVAEPVTVELHRGTETHLALGVPPLADILHRQCGPDANEEMRILAGVVRDAMTGRPARAAVVSASRELVPDKLRRFASSALNNTAVTDSLGRYVLCDVPLGQTVTVSARDDRRASDFITVEFGFDSVALGGRGTIALNSPVTRLDLMLLAPEFHTGQISGYVVNDNTDEPVAGATVSIDGTGYTTETDSTGAFNLSGTPSGKVGIAIRKLGYQMLRHDITVSPGAVAVLSSNVLRMRALDSEAYVLDPIRVEARRAATHATTGFEERRSTRMGSFVTREEFEAWNPTMATDVLRRMRGLRVVPNLYYGMNGDTRRFVIQPSRDIGQRVTRLVTTNAERVAANLGATETEISECPALLFLDGVYLGDSRTTNVDNVISVNTLGALEVYSPSQVPPRFALPGSTCGVVLFWTR